MTATAATANAFSLHQLLHSRLRSHRLSSPTPTTIPAAAPPYVLRSLMDTNNILAHSTAVETKANGFFNRSDIHPSESSLFDEIHDKAAGEHTWPVNLLDPLRTDLRRHIIKCGELCQATYDAFDCNPSSRYHGSCLYRPDRLFDKLGLASWRTHSVVTYLYAMSRFEVPHWLERCLHAEAWSRDSNWMGLVSVSGDNLRRREIVVAWRGTVKFTEWAEDFQFKLDTLEHNAKVEHGFHSIYTSKSESTRYNKMSASEQAMNAVKKLVEFYRDERGEEVHLTITGHSLGGAIAIINAHEAAVTWPDLPVSTITFGAPIAGDAGLSRRLGELGVKILRVEVKQDKVPSMPGIKGYVHAGEKLELDVRSSPVLKHWAVLPDFVGFHSLETYLHLVDGFSGKGKDFRKEARRNLALVNKACGLLREELGIPKSWYEKKKNQNKACGTQREPEDIPSPSVDWMLT